MRRPSSVFLALLAIACVLGARCTSGRQSAIGREALALTEKIVAFGPRPPQSEGLGKVRAFLAEEIRRRGFAPREDAFVAQTPVGAVDMVNLSYPIEGARHDRKVLLVAHYDSKRMDGIQFVGANDAASSVALLLVLSSALREAKLPLDVEVVFVDGEEALVAWSATDSLYGSRRYAAGIPDPAKIRAAFIVDMIGDADLTLIRSGRSAPDLVQAMARALDRAGRPEALEKHRTEVEDDHVPFADLGIPVLHWMDFRYGGTLTPGYHWHTAGDTPDKLSAASLGLVGQAILDVLSRI